MQSGWGPAPGGGGRPRAHPPPHATSATKRRQAVRAAMGEVSDYLGNTPAVARGSYVDPRLIDAFEEGVTIEPTLQRLGTRRRRDPERSRDVIERAVLRLLRD
jgi:DNA topoisomerase I